MLKALIRLLKTEELNAFGFSSAEDFLKHPEILRPACLVTDVCMPGLSGLDLQTELARRGIELPIVFLTGRGTVPMSVRAMKAGAVDFLQKPFRHEDLLDVIRRAVAKDARLSASSFERREIERRLRTLTPREREVFDLVIKGLMNKEIAAELGATERTIKVHRHRVTAKLRVNSVAEMVQAAVKVGALDMQACASQASRPA